MKWKVFLVLLAGGAMYVYSQPKLWDHLVTVVSRPAETAPSAVAAPSEPAPAKVAPVAIVPPTAPPVAPHRSADFNPNAGPNDLEPAAAPHVDTGASESHTGIPSTALEQKQLAPAPALSTLPPAKLNP